MCGFVGYVDLRQERPADEALLRRMTQTLVHRGPDDSGFFVEGSVALGFRRLSIIDPEGGHQPLFNEDGSLVLLCNGEIFNYIELRRRLEARGHSFSSRSDVEVLLHLYEEHEEGLLKHLNGQFAFVIYDQRRRRLLLARDQFGINPLYYTVADGLFIFGSEVKALLEHGAVRRAVDLTGLDQTLSFPGLVSPRTMFEGIKSLRSGCYLVVEGGEVKETEYWDLDYPEEGGAERRSESYYVEELRGLFERAVRYRLQADVPVGFYLSGGLDSSMIAGMIERVSPGSKRHAFSIGFREREMSESGYQREVAQQVGARHHEIEFGWSEIEGRLRQMIYHSECPVKETYNTCSLALSAAAKANGITVILTGEGADELFAGYVGYRFDQLGNRGRAKSYDLETVLEEEMREKLWGDKDLFYETNHHAHKEIKSALYSEQLNDVFDEFDCLNFPLVNKDRLRGRHFVHQRSYLDFKLRLSDHLISDHGDRMGMANSVEARYPFLDIDLIEFSRHIPPDLKLRGFTEKYVLRKVAEGLVPRSILEREKFGFHAPGSPYLLQQGIEWINDLLSYERIKRQGYFNPDVIERLKKQYSRPDFKLSLPFESDLLIVVLTFGIFLDVFNLPNLN